MAQTNFFIFFSIRPEDRDLDERYVTWRFYLNKGSLKAKAYQDLDKYDDTNYTKEMSNGFFYSIADKKLCFLDWQDGKLHKFIIPANGSDTLESYTFNFDLKYNEPEQKKWSFYKKYSKDERPEIFKHLDSTMLKDIADTFSKQNPSDENPWLPEDLDVEIYNYRKLILHCICRVRSFLFLLQIYY